MRAVVFDVGETIVDESSSWEAFAAHVGVPVARVRVMLDRAVAERRHRRTALEAAAGRRLLPGEFTYVPTARDLYPDAVGTLRLLAGAGYDIGIVGNQPQYVEAFLTSLSVPLALVGSSERWGVEKPDSRFFQRIAAEVGLAPREIVYVGDRLDNDILPARAVGLRTVLVVRGPWGRAHATWPEACLADAKVAGLTEIVALLG